MKKNFDKIEQGPLRPPSERDSLFLRVVRNCPWNKCKFCPAYKNEKFSIRKSDDIIQEIIQLKEMNKDKIIKNVFLQDGDALSLPVDELKKILIALNKNFHDIERITAYARSSMLVNRSVKDLKDLKKLGLTRIHVGFESGSDEVLHFMSKGTSAKKQLEGCLRVKEAEIELCTYVMPGLGGKKMSKSHITETAKMIKQIEPDHIRFRTTFVLENTPLANEYLNGSFEPLSELEMVMELKVFLEKTKKINSTIISDHRINLLFELEGNIKNDYKQMIKIINDFLNMNQDEQKLFIAGRRLRLIKKLDELTNEEKRKKIKKNLIHIKSKFLCPKVYYSKNKIY